MSHVSIPSRSDANSSKRVTNCRVKSCWDYNQLWVELFDDWKEDLLTSENVIFVSNHFFLVALDIKGELYIKASTSTFPNSLILANRSWIKLTQIKSVNRDIKNRWILPEDLCSSFTDMNIPIKYAYFLDAKLFLGNFSANCDIVEKAEASNRWAMSVMPRWSNYCESIVNLISTDSSDGFNRATSRYKGGLGSIHVLVCVLNYTNVLLRLQFFVSFRINASFKNLVYV
jgi:hypothetical protein